jgi:hypothetical protein
MDNPVLFPGGTVRRERVVSERCLGTLPRNKAQPDIDSWNL